MSDIADTLSGQALIDAFVEFERANGRQAKVLAVGAQSDEAVALHVVQLGHVGHLDVVTDESLGQGSWELRPAVTARTAEQMAADAAIGDGTVQPYPGLAAAAAEGS